MRKLQRQIAKARLKAMGVGSVNRKMRMTDQYGVPLLRRVLTGDLKGRAEVAQRSAGIKAKRKMRRVTT